MKDRAVDKCPHCGKPLNVSLFAKAEAESSLTLVLTPKEGSYLGLKTVGGVLVDLERLIRATGETLDVKSAAFLKNATVENHGIKVDVLIVNAGGPMPQQAVEAIEGEK